MGFSDSLCRRCRHLHPDYLRPGGDYDSWQVRDAATGEQLAGLGYWDRIEGALARQIVLGRCAGWALWMWDTTDPRARPSRCDSPAWGYRLIAPRDASPERDEVAVPEPIGHHR